MRHHIPRFHASMLIFLARKIRAVQNLYDTKPMEDMVKYYCVWDPSDQVTCNQEYFPEYTTMEALQADHAKSSYYYKRLARLDVRS